MTLLAIENITVKYGPIPAIRDVSLQIREGETLAVVGANGAGKSTLTLAVTGIVRPASGRIDFSGHSLLGLGPEATARLGVALVPEGRHIFEGLTVDENLLLGTTVLADRGSARPAMAQIYEMFPILCERRNGMATRLSGGEQQQLAIARALLSKPRLLILDEPSLGLSPVMVDKIYAILAELKSRGTTLLLIEQNPARIDEVADRVMVLSSGAVQASGPAADILADGQLHASYLGGDAFGERR